MEVMGTKLQSYMMSKSRYLMSSMTIAVNNSVLYWKFAKRIDFRCSFLSLKHAQVTIGDDGFVNLLDHGNNFIIRIVTYI